MSGIRNHDPSVQAGEESKNGLVFTQYMHV
jgi:hypothetical protein